MDTKFPGYVLVKQVGELIKNINNDSYEYFQKLYCPYVTQQLPSEVPDYVQHGPAMKRSHAAHLHFISLGGNPSLDIVYNIRCLMWPTQAADWPERHRKHDWPDSTTVDRIVNNGCDVVQIAHPECRLDEWTRRHQWRLSFSRAETILLNSWSVKQQIVYHVLRIFMKTVRSKYNTGDSINNYHIKTMMLWACELDSPTVWKTFSVISACMRLIRRLAKCVKSSEFSAYFTSSCNLLEISTARNSQRMNCFAEDVMNWTKEQLCWWLIENYIRQRAEEVPCKLAVQFPNFPDLPMVSRALSALVKWRQSTFKYLPLTDVTDACFLLQNLIFRIFSPTMKEVCQYIIEQLHEIDPGLLTYYGALCFLKVASMLERGHSVSQMADTVTTIVCSLEHCLDDSALLSSTNDEHSKFVPVPSTFTQSVIVCKYFDTASGLLRRVRQSYNSVTSLSRLLIEMSKTYLRSSLYCSNAECSKFHGMSRCVLNVYLACLYFSNKQVTSAVNHCKTAIISSRKQDGMPTLHHIERHLLPCFDDCVETKMGLILLYSFLMKKHRGHRYNDQQVDVFSGDLFAYYVMNLCVNVRCSRTFCQSRRKTYDDLRKCFTNKKNLTVADVLIFHEIYRKNHPSGRWKELFDSISYKCGRHAITMKSLKFRTRLCRLLVQSAVENLTAFRSAMSAEFIDVTWLATDDFLAMYAYKFNLIEECLNICEANVRWLLHERKNNSVFSARDSDLLRLMDDDYLSLIGLAKLCGSCELRRKSAEGINQLTLSVYFLVQSKLRLKHSAATFIDTLFQVKCAWFKVHREDLFAINRAMLIFVYRKLIHRSLSSNIHLSV
jgi:hypothetical protein